MPRAALLTVILSCAGAAMAADTQKADTEKADTQQGDLKTIGKDTFSGLAQAVVVNDRALAHSTQCLPLDAAGKLVGGDDVAGQVKQVLASVDAALQAAGSSLAQSVKLNVYVTERATLDEVNRQLAARFTSEHKPAVSYVVTPLPVAGAQVALDAVAVVPNDNKEATQSSAKVALHRAKSLPGKEHHAAVLPRGDAVYISGQAEPGKSVGEASAATLAGLGRTLEHYKLSKQHIVQLKCFLEPMADVKQTEAAIAEFFAGEPVPPVVYVAWIGGPIEIELIAAAPATKEAPSAASYLTPPWMQSSPNYCRVVRVHGPRRLYTAGLYAAKKGDGAAEVRSVFAQLQEILKAAGGDLKHLAKATYYVSDNDASTKLNTIRPEFYSPDRPPAASKAAVKDVGQAERTITMDIIGVIP